MRPGNAANPDQGANPPADGSQDAVAFHRVATWGSGTGDYVWSVKRDDLPGMAERMTAQVIGYLNDQDGMMAAGIAKLAARCGLDYLHAEEREQVPLPTDYHLNENGKPACGRNDESRKVQNDRQIAHHVSGLPTPDHQ